MTETDLQRQVIASARQLGWLVAHFRSVKTHRGTWETPVQGDGKGFPDLVLVRGDRAIVVELKSHRGIVDQQQHRWLAAFRMAGVPAYTWRPADWESGEIVRVLLGVAVEVTV